VIPEKAELLRKERTESGGSSQYEDGRAAEGKMMAARPDFFAPGRTGKEGSAFRAALLRV
jgi:hypothetical protein